jgi:hypothetical protein
MEGHSESQSNPSPTAASASSEEGEHCNDCPDPSNILQPSWVRRLVCLGDKVDGLVSGNRHYLLFHFGILFWAILLAKKS